MIIANEYEKKRKMPKACLTGWAGMTGIFHHFVVFEHLFSYFL
jgi:hypothetical protein